MISPADRAGPAPRAAWQARAFWLRVLVAAACGALFSAALPALSLWPLGSALVPLFVIVARVERRWDAFWPGFFFGLAFFVLYIFWLPRSFAELFGPAAWLIFPPLLGVLAAFWGIVTGASRALGGRGAGTLWLLPALWLLMEWARTQGSLAFPWGSLGYLWLGTPLAQVASLTGLYGLSLLTAVLAALLAAPFVVGWRRSLWPLAAAVLLAGSGLAYGLAWLRSPLPPRTETALLVQGNTDPLGRTLSLDQEMDLYASLTRQALAAGTPVDLVVWPEGVVPDNKIAGYQGAAGRQKILSAAGGATIITGGTAAERGRYYNSAFSLADGRITDRYDKVYLVPFGESFPFIDSITPVYRAVFGLFGLPLLASRSPGHALDPLAAPTLLSATYICYESVFPQVARSMVARGAEVLVNISNDAWFGRGHGAEQHYDMGRLRAIETHRYLLRAGNNGITALIDPFGRTVVSLPRGVQDTLRVRYGTSDTTTPYVRYGDWPVILAALFALVSIGGRWMARQR